MPSAALLGVGRLPMNMPPPPMAMGSQLGGFQARLNLMAQSAMPPGLDEETLRFDVQLHVLEKLLASENGAWVRSVSNRTGARIQVKRDAPAAGGKYYLEISGQPEQAVEAESLAEDAVRMIGTAAIADAADAVAAGGAVASGPCAAMASSVPGATTLQRPPRPA